MFACKSLKYKVYKAIIFNMLSARPKAFQSFHFAPTGWTGVTSDIKKCHLHFSITFFLKLKFKQIIFQKNKSLPIVVLIVGLMYTIAAIILYHE